VPWARRVAGVPEAHPGVREAGGDQGLHFGHIRNPSAKSIRRPLSSQIHLCKINRTSSWSVWREQVCLKHILGFVKLEEIKGFTCTTFWEPLQIRQLWHIMWLSVSFRKSSPTKSSTYCQLLLIEILSWRFCGVVDFLKLINGRCVWSTSWDSWSWRRSRASRPPHSPSRTTNARARYRGTSLIRNSLPLGPHSRTTHMVLWWF